MADDSSSAPDLSKIKILDPSTGKLRPATTADMAPGKGAEPLGGEEAAMSTAPSPLVRGLEGAGKFAAEVGGGLAGGALGLASPVPGGMAVGSVTGMGLAGWGADALNAEINNKIYGTPKDLSPAALQANLKENMGGAAVGGLLGGAAEKTVMEPIIGAVKDKMAAASEETLLGPRGIAAATGVSPEETEASLHAQGEMTPEGVRLPPKELTDRRMGLRDATFGPAHKIQEAIGQKFDTHFEPHMDTDVDVGDLRAQPQEIRDWAAKPENNYTLSPKIQKLLGKVEKIGASENGLWDVTAKFHGIPSDEFAKLPLPEQQALMKSVMRSVSGGDMGPLSQEQVAQVLYGQSELKPSAVAKVREMLGVRHEASSLMGSEASAVDRSAANDIIESIDKHLENSGIPGAKELRGEYATHKASFGKDFYRNIAKSGKAEPIESAPDIFNNKDVARDLYESGDATQQAFLRRFFGDWVNQSASEGKSVIDWGLQRDFLKAAFPGTKLAEPTPWQKMPSAIDYATKYLAKDKDATKQIAAIAQQDIETQAAEAAKQGGQQALQNRELAGEKGYTARMMEAFRRRGPVYGAVALGGVITGHVSPFMAAAAGMAGADLTREQLTQAISWTLSKNPALAEKFIGALADPGSAVNRQIFGKALAGTFISNEAQKLSGYGDLEKEPAPADINDISKGAAIKSKEGGVRAVEPGESHDDAVRRTGMKGAVHGFNDQNGEFMDRKTAQAQIKGLGGKDEAPHSDQIALGPRESEPEPVSLGSSPVRQLVSGWVNANPKGPVLRDLDDAAREYRRGNIPAMDPQKWLQKGLTPQEIANGYKLSGMSRMDAALSQLSVPQLTDAWKIAQKTHDEADGNRIKNVLAKQLKDGAWSGLKPEEKKRVAQALRDVYAPDKSLNEA